jgi:hypothetical protein
MRGWPLDEARSRPVDDPAWTLHDVSYFGRVDVVARLLDAGAETP